MPRAKSSQKADRKAGTKAGTLVPQKHGGAIWKGTPETIVPGPGRTPNHVRQMAVELGIAKALPKLEAILDDPTSTKQEIISAAREVLGVIPRKDETVLTEHPEWQRRMTALRSALVEIVGEETATQVILRADELARR